MDFSYSEEVAAAGPGEALTGSESQAQSTVIGEPTPVERARQAERFLANEPPGPRGREPDAGFDLLPGHIVDGVRCFQSYKERVAYDELWAQAFNGLHSQGLIPDDKLVADTMAGLEKAKQFSQYSVPPEERLARLVDPERGHGAFVGTDLLPGWLTHGVRHFRNNEERTAYKELQREGLIQDDKLLVDKMPGLYEAEQSSRYSISAEEWSARRSGSERGHGAFVGTDLLPGWLIRGVRHFWNDKELAEYENLRLEGLDSCGGLVYEHAAGSEPGDNAPGGNTTAEPPRLTQKNSAATTLYEIANTPSRPFFSVRSFETNAEGEQYGEQYLSYAWDNLSTEMQQVMLDFTWNSHTYQALLRSNNVNMFRPDGGLDPDSVRQQLKIFYSEVDDGWALYELAGFQPPTLADIYAVAPHASGLSYLQGTLVHNIINSDNPERTLQRTIRAGAGMRGIYTAAFGHWPTVDEVLARIHAIDQALDNPLPENLEILRSVKDVSFIGHPRSRHVLIREHHEAGYSSGSLGNKFASPTQIPPRGYFRLKAMKGVRGLWIGPRSSHPEQQEFVLHRACDYQDIIASPSHGTWNINGYLRA